MDLMKPSFTSWSTAAVRELRPWNRAERRRRLKPRFVQRRLVVYRRAETSSVLTANSSPFQLTCVLLDSDGTSNVDLYGTCSPAIASPEEHVPLCFYSTIDAVQPGLRPETVQACPR